MTCEFFWDEKEKLNKISKFNINLNFVYTLVENFFKKHFKTTQKLSKIENVIKFSELFKLYLPFPRCVASIDRRSFRSSQVHHWGDGILCSTA